MMNEHIDDEVIKLVNGVMKQHNINDTIWVDDFTTLADGIQILIDKKRGKLHNSITLREYEVWLYNKGYISRIDFDWHKEFLKETKELE